MAASKLAILSVFLALILSQIRADASVPAEEDEPVKLPRSDGPDSSALKIELDQLRAKIHSLGSFLSSSANSRVYWTKFGLLGEICDFSSVCRFDFFPRFSRHPNRCY
ncbi:histone deacetylase 18-like [Pyrus ussuriensis x Pyrus communis]|uniref:Histone deacetylase 18-like n=1 Tax=Pyrus ussuriensis x Pyrus communis TaxID=2448454 RepID=A0A5N5GVA3_9ROSA|nr:histone deacetylase 18-like [Pyrus ussuriensis x Pyrus communis]